MRALDLFCGAGGVSVGLERAGFDVTGVDIAPQPRYRGGRFIQADAMTFPLDGYDFIWASPPCQAFTPLRSLHPGREYPDLIATVRERLKAQPAPWCLENVPQAPLAGNLILLCGTMFGLQTPDGRAEIRRHRFFETSWPIALRPACQHGHVSQDSLTVTGHSYGTHAARQEKRDVMSVAGEGSCWGSKRRVLCVAGGKRMSVRQTYSIEDARAAMGIDWMTMKGLSQAIPPAYAEYIGRQLISALSGRLVAALAVDRVAAVEGQGQG